MTETQIKLIIIKSLTNITNYIDILCIFDMSI